MISQTAEYALRAMAFLALKLAAVTTQEIAEATKVPAGYLSKIMQLLVKGKLVNSQRGIGGGFVLARNARDISILDVVNAVDPLEKISTCPLQIEGHGLNLCPLHRRLSDAILQVESAFAQSNLNELVSTWESPVQRASHASFSSSSKSRVDLSSRLN